jgi:hypothetical protein
MPTVVGGSMPPRQKALISYAERKGLCLWEGTPAFARRQRLLSRDQYELAEVRTSRRGRETGDAVP